MKILNDENLPRKLLHWVHSPSLNADWRPLQQFLMAAFRPRLPREQSAKPLTRSIATTQKPIHCRVTFSGIRSPIEL